MIPCPKCQKDNGTDSETLTPLARSAAAMVLCDDCEATRIEADLEKINQGLERQHLRRVSETLPPDLRRMRFSDSPAPSDARRAAEEWARTGGKLMLCGPVGTGKTGLAAAAVWTMLWARSCKWVSTPTVIANLTAAYDSEARAKALSGIHGTGAIAMDDLDKFKPSEWASTQIFAALDRRIQSGAPILVTANKTPAEIATHIGGEVGAAIGSRLAGEFRVVQVAGKDHRLAA